MKIKLMIFMTNPVHGSWSDPNILPSVKLTPHDANLLQTPFGKMFLKAAPNEDQQTLLKQVKLAVNQYCKDIVNQIQQDQARMDKAMQRLKNVAEGKDPDA
jgi:hypothetical protein